MNPLIAQSQETYCSTLKQLFSNPQLRYRRSTEITNEFLVQMMLSQLVTKARKIALGDKDPSEGVLWYAMDTRAVVPEYQHLFNKNRYESHALSARDLNNYKDLFKENTIEGLLVKYLLELKIVFSIMQGSEDDWTYGISIDTERFIDYVEQFY